MLEAPGELNAVSLERTELNHPKSVILVRLAALVAVDAGVVSASPRPRRGRRGDPHQAPEVFVAVAQIVGAPRNDG